MSDNKQNDTCGIICWLVAVLAGFAVFAWLIMLSKGGFMAVLLGLVVALVLGFGLKTLFCKAKPATVQKPVPQAAKTASVATAAKVDSAKADLSEGGAALAAPGSVSPAASLMSGDAGGDAVAKPPRKAKTSAVPKAAAKTAKATKPAAKTATKESAKPASKAAAKPVAKATSRATAKTGAKAAPKVAKAAATGAEGKQAKGAAKTAAKPEAKGAAKAAEKPPVKAAAKKAAAPKGPKTLKAARAAGADDLKMLKGVGPKLEKALNDLGFWHFDQVAAWTKADIEWVDSRLTVKGRIERDGWVAQADTLAKGGTTEFSKRVSKGEVY